MWGSLVWRNLFGNFVFYESHPPFEVISVYRGIVSSQYMALDWDDQLAVSQDKRLVMIFAIPLWKLWMLRCFKILENALLNPVTIVHEVWFDVIHTLMS